jgi:hypothetical protein
MNRRERRNLDACHAHSFAAAFLAAPAAQTPQASERVVLEGSVKVDRIDRSTRSMTVRSEDNQLFGSTSIHR